MATTRTERPKASERSSFAGLRLRLDEPPEMPRWIPVLGVAAATVVVVLTLRIDLVLAPTTPTNGDLGGHVWGPWQFGTKIFPSLSAWSPDWYGGFPAYLTYPFLPAAAVSALSLALPYGVALKLVILVACAVVPVAAWGMGRLGSLPEPAPSLMAVLVVVGLFDNSSLIGANLQSTIIGEFSEGLALPLALLSLGLFDRSLRTGRSRWLTALVMAAGALCHPVGALVLAAGCALLLVAHGVVEGRRSVVRALPILACSAAVSACWYVPLITYRGELGHGVSYAIAPYLGHFAASLPIWAELLVLPLALLGATSSILRRSTLGIALSALTLLLVLSSVVLAHLPFGSAATLQTAAWLAGRLLPIFELLLLLVAAMGLGAIATQLGPRWRSAGIATLALTSLVVIVSVGINFGWLPGSQLSPSAGTSSAVADNSWLGVVHVQTNSLPTTARVSFGGYERMPTWESYQQIVGEAGAISRRHGCGSFLAEGDLRGSYGSVFEFALLPYWTRGCAASISGGNPIETSWTATLADQAQAAVSTRSGRSEQVPYPRTDVTRGVTALKALGARYLMVYSPPIVAAARADSRLEEVGQANVWHFFAVKSWVLAAPLDRPPLVMASPPAADFSSWIPVASRWMLSGSGPRPAAGGPGSWPRTQAEWRRSGRLPETTVSHLRSSSTGIEFDVSRVGVPVVVNVSYHPWWQAMGASGPWRIAPNAIVVIPRSKHVALAVGPGSVDAVAKSIALIGLAGIVGLAVFDRRRRLSERAAEPEDA